MNGNGYRPGLPLRQEKSSGTELYLLLAGADPEAIGVGTSIVLPIIILLYNNCAL